MWGRLGFPLRHLALAAECFGKIRVNVNAKGVSWSAGRSDFLHAARFDICRSTDPKSRVLPAPATLVLAISAAEPEIPPGTHFRTARSSVVPPTFDLVGAHQGSADHALNLGLLFFADVPYAIDLCAMVWFSSRDYGRGVNARPIEQQSRSSRDENNGCNRIVRFCSQDG